MKEEIARMRPILLRGAIMVGAASVMVMAWIWLSKSQPDDLIPMAFRGRWLEQGAECQDTDAQLRITGSTIDYDLLSFKADGLADKQEDAVSLTGESFPGGKTRRDTVQLRMQDHRTRLLIVSRDLGRQGPFVRCSVLDD
jgi:hypothetical protein